MPFGPMRFLLLYFLLSSALKFRSRSEILVVAAGLEPAASCM